MILPARQRLLVGTKEIMGTKMDSPDSYKSNNERRTRTTASFVLSDGNITLTLLSPV